MNTKTVKSPNMKGKQSPAGKTAAVVEETNSLNDLLSPTGHQGTNLDDTGLLQFNVEIGEQENDVLNANKAANESMGFESGSFEIRKERSSQKRKQDGGPKKSVILQSRIALDNRGRLPKEFLDRLDH